MGARNGPRGSPSTRACDFLIEAGVIHCTLEFCRIKRVGWVDVVDGEGGGEDLLSSLLLHLLHLLSSFFLNEGRLLLSAYFFCKLHLSYTNRMCRETVLACYLL